MSQFDETPRKDWYRQCKFVKNTTRGDETEYTTSWIPERCAKKGNRCELLINGKYQEWWIYEVGSRARGAVIDGVFDVTAPEPWEYYMDW